MKDGGPAFPTNTLHVPFGESSDPKYQGMTLRDYFAAKAMTMLRSDGNAGWNACRAYEMADAMLKARQD